MPADAAAVAMRMTQIGATIPKVSRWRKPAAVVRSPPPNRADIESGKESAKSPITLSRDVYSGGIASPMTSASSSAM